MRTISYGVHISIGNIAQGDWRRDLIFDIDYIVAWACETDGGFQFRVGPAT